MPCKCKDFIVTLGGLVLFVADVVLDVWAIFAFYEEEDYVVLGLLVLLLLGSSVLVHVFSWLWYSYEHFSMETKVEGCVDRRLLKILHFLQLGVYLRYAGVGEVSLRSLRAGSPAPRDVDAHRYLSHDLRMLRLIEAFAESAPQIVLMSAVIIHRDEVEPVTFLKTVGSVSAIALSVTMYHRSLRSFLPGKATQGSVSSLVFLLWNLFLIAARLAALILFTSALPCYVPAHFLSLWTVLFFCAWRSQTNFMDSAGGEWLYRATVGLIWYFSWFNVAEGRTRNKTLLYYSVIAADMALLCGLWYWQITTEPPYFDPPLPPYVMLLGIAVLFSTGLLFRLVYYRFLHPTLTADELEQDVTSQGQDVTSQGQDVTSQGEDEVDFRTMILSRAGPPEPVVRVNKRMKSLAANFYT